METTETATETETPPNIALAENTLAAAVFDLAEADESLFGTSEPEVLCAHADGFAEQLKNVLAQSLAGAVVVRCGDAGTVKHQPAGANGAIVPVGEMNAAVEIYVPFLAAASCAEAEMIAQAVIASLSGAAFETPFTPKPLTVSSTSQGDTLVEERIRYHTFTVSLGFELILTA